MKKTIFALTVVAILTFEVSAWGQEVEWFTDHKAAEKTARETGKPMLFDFWATWCKPCMAMQKTFWPRQDVVEISKQFVCVKVDFDKDRGLASKYGINAIPNVVFTDPWGRAMAFEEGFGSASVDKIFEKISTLPTDYSSVVQAAKALEENEKDVEALNIMAVFYQDRKFYWISQDYYKKLVKVESNSPTREKAWLNLALNYIRLGKPCDALDKLESFRKEFPNTTFGDVVLYGTVAAQIQKKNVEKAQKALDQLKSRFPTSGYIHTAEKAVAEASVAR